MVAAIEASGRTVEDEVQRFQKLGLTLDDIKMDSDKLATGMKDLDDAARQSSGAVGDGFRKVAEAGDQSRSVMANFAGNALQELPGVAGAFGPLNMAISQFGEYAAEGNIQLKGLVSALGPMAVGTVIISNIAKAYSEAKDRAEDLRKAQEALADQDTAQAAESLVAAYGDLYRTFGDLGVSADRVTQAIYGNADAYDELHNKAIDAQVSADGLTRLMGDKAVTVLANARSEWESTGRSLTRNKDLTEQVTATLDTLIGKEEDHTAAQQEVADAARKVADAERDLLNARLAAIDSTFASRAAQDAYAESMQALATAVDDPTTAVDEFRQAQDRALQSGIGVAQANLAQAESLAALSGKTLTAGEQQKVMVDSLNYLAGALEPGSPVRAALEGYITQLGGVPASVTTTVAAEGTDDATSRFGEVKMAAEDIEDPKVEAKADVSTAKSNIDSLDREIRSVPSSHATTFTMEIGPAVRSIGQLRAVLQQLIDKANEADRAVARVAG